MPSSVIELKSVSDMQGQVNEMRGRVQEAAAQKSWEALKQEITRIQLEAEAAKREINEAAARSDGKSPIRVIEKSKDIQASSLQRKLTETGLKEAIKVCQRNPDIIPQNLNSASQQILKGILTSIKDPETQINQDSAPYIYEIFNRAINNRITNPLDALPKDELAFLHAVAPTVHNRVVNVLADAARQQGAGEDEVKRFVGEAKFPDTNFDTVTSTSSRSVGLDRPRYVQREDWDRATTEEEKNKIFVEAEYEGFFNTDNPEEMRVVTAIHDRERFIDLVQRYRDAINADPATAGQSAEEKNKLLSKKISDSISLVFARMFSKVDNAQPTVPFDNIISIGFNQSIQSQYERMKSAFHNLAVQFELNPDVGLQGVDFFKRSSVEESVEKLISYKDKDGKEHKRVVNQYKIAGIPGGEKVNTGGFLRAIEVVVGAEVEMKGYMHNAGAILARAQTGGDRGSFWNQMAGFAAQMTSIDIDTLQILPDYEIFLEVFQLYSKYLENDFAKLTWVHEGGMFGTGFEDTRSVTEKEILNDIRRDFKRIHPDIEEWRLKRAITYGIGLSKGVFLTEEQIAASADPSVDRSTGSPTYKSLYFSDSTPLNAFNPMHTLFRWQSREGQVGPLLFAPVRGLPESFLHHWDHRKVWEWMKQHQDTFSNGKSAFGGGDTDVVPVAIGGHKIEGRNVKLFYDLLPNIGRVGDIITRAGWRLSDATSHWYKYEVDAPSNKETAKIIHLDTWKAIENIGFEVMLDYINNKIGKDDDFLSGVAVQKVNGRITVVPTNTAQRDSLFEYLYGKYIDPQGTSTFHQELVGARADAEKNLETNLKENDFGKDFTPPKNPAERVRWINAETYKLLLYRSLAGMMRDRMPTKMFRLDRDRFSATGVRFYERIKHYFQGPRPAGATDDAERPWNAGWDQDKYHRAVRDILKVETILRRETTAEMDKYVQRNNNKLLGFSTNDYKVDSASIRRVLGEYFSGEARLDSTLRVSPTDIQDRIDKAVAVYEKIFENTFDKRVPIGKKFMDELANKIRKRPEFYPFALGTEELASSFIAIRAAGPTVLQRCLKDIGGFEDNGFKMIEKYLETMLGMAKHGRGKDGFGELIKPLDAMRKYVEGLHGPYSFTEAKDVANLALVFFRKDTDSENPIKRWGRVGVENSLAAEFVGGSEHVKDEWDFKDSSNYISALGKEDVVPTQPYDQREGGRFMKVDRTIFGKKSIKLPLLGEIKFGSQLKKRRPDQKNLNWQMRKEWGVTHTQVVWGVVTKYFAILMAFLMWKFIKQSLDEAQGTQKK